MKNTKISFRLILAALAATVALTACTKEPAPGKVDTDPKAPQSEGSRIIAVSFAPQTKTYLDEGLQPKFNDGDSVLLVAEPKTEGAVPDTQSVAVSVDPETGKATITTTLHGTLRALYPAKSAIFAKENFNIYVPAEQSGKFEDANICQVRQIEENADNVQFENMYSLFIITPPEGTKKLIVRSLREIGEDGQRSEKRYPLNGEDKDTITVGDGTAAVPSPCYIALLGTGINLSDLSFEASPDAAGTAGYIKGIPTSAIADAAGGAVGSEQYEGLNYIRRNVAYTIDENNWHEYVTIASRKWAVNNVGEYGDYYMWGTSVVAYEDHPSQRDDMIVFVEENPYGEEIYQNEWNKNAGYCWNNTPFTKGVFLNGNDVFVKYTASVDTIAFTGSADGKTILDLEDDAAYANWGGAWRMPTSDELDAVKGDDNFWPAGALNGANGDDVDSEGSFGYYWSSTLDTEHPEKAKCLRKESGFQGNIEPQPRYWGCTVRAIIDEGTILPPSED